MIGPGHRKFSKEECDAFFGDRHVIDFPGFLEFLASGANKDIGFKLLDTYRVMFVVGGPGSGKGTLCGKLVEQRSHVKHISSGDLLRHEVASGSKLGKELQAIMQSGKLVDASTVLALLDKALGSSYGTVVLLDGFPRSLDNAVDFYELFGPGEGLLIFECPEDEMIRRIVNRGKGSGRVDDNEETAKKRIEIFKSQSLESVRFLREKAGIPVISIDATKPISENVDFLKSLPIFQERRHSHD